LAATGLEQVIGAYATVAASNRESGQDAAHAGDPILEGKALLPYITPFRPSSP
jgi:hypothetical protein